MKEAAVRLRGWRHVIAVLVAIACLAGGVSMAVAAPFLWLSDDIAVATSKYASREDVETQMESLRRRAGSLAPRQLDAEVGDLAYAKLPMADYALRAPWRRARKIGAVALILAIFMIVSSIGVFRALEKSRRLLMCCCVAVAGILAVFSVDVSHGLAAFSTDIMRDLDVASGAVRRHIGVIPQSRPVQDLAMLGRSELQRVGWVLFAVLSLPWQLAAVVLTLLRPTVQADSADVHEVNTGD